MSILNLFKKSGAVIFVIIFFQSCTILIATYFRNLSNTSIMLFYPNKSSNDFGNQKSFRYKNEVLKINKKTWEKLSDSIIINYTLKGVSLVVPPYSTVELRNLSVLSDNDTVFVINTSDYYREMPKITILDTVTANDFNFKGYFSKQFQKYDYKK
jgi:hypothetical protein